MKHWRTHAIVFILFLLGATIVGRLVFLQIMQEGFYKALAQGQQNIVSISKGQRGNIFAQDKEGRTYTLAANQKLPFAYISPIEITEKREQFARELAAILELPEENIIKKLNQEESFFAVLKKQISPEEQEALENLPHKGIYVGQEEVRTYPQGTFAAHIAGFANQDGEGQYGVEEYYNNALEGKEGLQGSSFNPASYIIAKLSKGASDGADLTLTVDYNIQQMAESLLQEHKEQLHYKAGTIMVLNPKTGALYALANTPVFNPNEYSDQTDLGVFQNAAVEKIFEPGSVMKAITMAAALDAKKVTPNTTYQDYGELTISGETIYNYDYKTHGVQTMAGVLQRSINTGAVFAEQQLGHTRFLEYLETFKFFEPTGIDMAGEIYSKNPVVRNGYDINFATASFGQGIEMTPLQLVRAYTALANNGHMVEPVIGQHRIGEHKPTRVISQQAATDVTTMLVESVEKNRVGEIPGYYIAGKTGTAQIPWSVLGIHKAGYADEQTVQSFIGYFPAYDPQFLVLVKLDQPQTKAAGASAIPMFKELAQYIIRYYQIPPDYDTGL
jgi:cell division protein FtsI/penicillin-binding protein 2